MRQSLTGMTALLLVLLICSAPVLVALVASRQDISNRFPETGAFIVWAGPNAAGFREGLRGICTGALIHERVFLTAGHCAGRGVRGVPPFVQVAVSFNPANAFDRSSWVPVVSDGGTDCANKDARVRVDTSAVHEWITRVIRDELGSARLEP